MDKLGTEYDSIFDYSREHPEEALRVRCLVMYDFLAISAIRYLRMCAIFCEMAAGVAFIQ